MASTTDSASTPPQLLRIAYNSEATGLERDYFVYLPPDFEKREEWPVLVFLHGNGERGNGKDELDYVLIHGPLFEAWVQRRDLPFVIVSPQLPMFSMGDVPYIKERTADSIPVRLEEGVHPVSERYMGEDPIVSSPLVERVPTPPKGLPEGWPLLEDEVMAMVEKAITDFRGDPSRIYLSGISYGGFGTWWIGSRHTDIFAALAPVVGYGHPELAAPIAAAQTPIWIFAGGRDGVVRPEFFYPVARALEAAGHRAVRFTVHVDQGHDAWKRIYAGRDLYDWLLDQRLEASA